MATKDDIKSKFSSGSTPTQNDFASFIDFTVDASNIDVGTIPALSFPSTLDLTQNGSDSTLIAANIKGNGSQLTQLSAVNVSDGILAVARIPDLSADKIYDGRFDNERMPLNISTSSYSGNGAGLTNLNASSISTGTLSNNQLPQNIDVTKSGEESSIIAKTLVGSGSAITDLNATNLTSGLLNTDRLPGLNANKIISGRLDNLRMPQDITAGSFSGDGSAITGINAGNISTGELPVTHLPDFDAAKITTGIINVSRLQTATENGPGITRFANLTQARAGTDDDKAISPIRLSTVINEYWTDLDFESNIKGYVDTKIDQVKAGLKFKDNVVAVATGKITIDPNAPTLPTIDGVLLTDGDRVLLTDQASSTDNRVWIAEFGTSWTVADDFDGDLEGELAVGVSVEVLNGNSEKGSVWSISDVIDGYTWKRRNDVISYSEGTGVQITETTISVDTSWIDDRIASNVVLPPTLPQRVGTEIYEKPVLGHVYYSPAQHGGFFGVVLRRYIDSAWTDGTEIVNIPGGELIDSKLLVTFSGDQMTLDQGVLETEAPEPATSDDTGKAKVALLAGGKLELQLASTYGLRGGWVDYVWVPSPQESNSEDPTPGESSNPGESPNPGEV